MARSTSGNGRRRGDLSREVIIEAATVVAAAGENITFRALGDALGSDPTAVYRHFKAKDELVRCVYDQLMLGAVERLDSSASWREQIRQLAVIAWEISEQHPFIGRDAHMLTTGGPGELANIEVILEQLLSIGLDRDEAVRYYAVIGGYVLSVASTLSARRISEPDVDFGRPTAWLSELGSIDAGRYPAIAQTRESLAELDIYGVSLMGVEVLLDAAEAAAARS